MVIFVSDVQGPYGLWEHTPRLQASRWVTFDLLRSLSRLDQQEDWVSLEPRTPFQAYPKIDERYRSGISHLPLLSRLALSEDLVINQGW